MNAQYKRQRLCLFDLELPKKGAATCSEYDTIEISWTHTGSDNE